MITIRLTNEDGTFVEHHFINFDDAVEFYKENIDLVFKAQGMEINENCDHN